MPSMSSEDYVAIRQIGKGAFGTAHIVQHKVTGERFVLKRVRLARQSARERQSSVKELLLLSNLRHRNVLEFKGCWIEGGCNLCMLVEMCESGDLFSQLRLRHPTSIHFSEEHLQEMAVQLLSALAYLHRSNIAHRDLKTANILIRGDGCLKLADFGLSTVLEQESNRMTKTVVGTPNYMSPCVLQEKPYGTPNDVWGLGCVLFELSSLKPAFQAFNMAGLIKKVTSGPPPPVPSCYSEHWRNLIRAMLTKEPDMRPSASELLELEWLQPAVRRVVARFGPEFPHGAPELLDRLTDLPPDIMALLDAFQAQEREEKRRADEARERRKAAVMKWDPVVRAAAAAQAAAAMAVKQPKLPPLKPHVPRKPAPRVIPARGNTGAAGGGPPPCGVPPLVAGAAAGDCGGSPRVASGVVGAVGDRPCLRRKTYCGDGGKTAGGARIVSSGKADGRGGGGRGFVPLRQAKPSTLPGCVTPSTAAAWMGQVGAVLPAPLPDGSYPQQQRQHQDGHDNGEADGSLSLSSSRLRSHRPSSAPPDSPVRRSRRGPRESTGSSGAGPRTSVRGDGPDRQGLDATSSLGSLPLSALCSSSLRVSSASTLGAAPSLIANPITGSPIGSSSVAGVSCAQQQQQQQLQQQQQHRKGDATAQQTDLRDSTEMQENSDSTFRYLPAVRNLSGASSRSPGGQGSRRSSCSSEAVGDDYRNEPTGNEVGGRVHGSADGGLPVQHRYTAAPLPRRANSESVVRIKREPMATSGPGGKVPVAVATATPIGMQDWLTGSKDVGPATTTTKTQPAPASQKPMTSALSGSAAVAGGRESRPATREGHGADGPKAVSAAGARVSAVQSRLQSSGTGNAISGSGGGGAVATATGTRRASGPGSTLGNGPMGNGPMGKAAGPRGPRVSDHVGLGSRPSSGVDRPSSAKTRQQQQSQKQLKQPSQPRPPQ